VGGFRDIGNHARRQKHKKGPNLFAFAFYDVAGNAIEQWHSALHSRFEFVFKQIHFFSYGLPDVIEIAHGGFALLR
jgi:hypothetical protein